jgi:hypothetical protein
LAVSVWGARDQETLAVTTFSDAMNSAIKSS